MDRQTKTLWWPTWAFWLLVVPFALACAMLSGCGGGGGGEDSAAPVQPTGAVGVKCVNVTNDGTKGCVASPAAAIVVNRGEVSRSEAMWASATFVNGLLTPFTGAYAVYLAPGCNGETEQMMVTSNVRINPSEQLASSASRQCAAMPLGPAEVRVILYDAPFQTVCETPPDQVCTTFPSGQTSCTPGDVCRTVPGGSEVDRGTAQYVVVP